MKIEFAPRNQCEANGQAAFALVVSLLDVLARKTDLLTEGEVSLIIEDALRSMPDSPHPLDEKANELVAALRGKIKKPAGKRRVA